MNKTCLFYITAVCLIAFTTQAAITVVTDQGDPGELPVPGSTDLIQGQIASELPGDTGWHPANTDPQDQLPALTDGIGLNGLAGLMNDFPGSGTPTKRIQYNLAAPTDIAAIDVFSGNAGRDGRVFHTYTVSFSVNSGTDWSVPLYVQSHPSGTINDGVWSMVYTHLSDTSGTLAANVTNLRFDFYAVDNTAGQIRDPFDGVNPFTAVDDGLTAAFVAPLILEIDVTAVPEPAALTLLVVGSLIMSRRRY